MILNFFEKRKKLLSTKVTPKVILQLGKINIFGPHTKIYNLKAIIYFHLTRG